MTEAEKKVVLVTGGSGLVGSGIKAVVEEEARNNETWVFLSSKVEFAIPVIFFPCTQPPSITILINFFFLTGCQSLERDRD